MMFPFGESFRQVGALVRIATSAALLLALAGCATTLKEARAGPGERFDPWESWNRKVFAFNEGLDRYALKPVATGYSKVVPQLVRTGIDNVFSNFSDAWSAVNSALQGKATPAFNDTVRFGTNSFFGILGVFDVATELGIDRHPEDFGQTLGTWGVGPGAYIVWPLIGPSTVRDTVALPLDRVASPTILVSPALAAVEVTGVHIINTRARLLGAGQVLDDISLDKYTFVRDAYLQRRRAFRLDGTDAGDSDPLYAPIPTEPNGVGVPIRK